MTTPPARQFPDTKVVGVALEAFALEARDIFFFRPRFCFSFCSFSLLFYCAHIFTYGSERKKQHRNKGTKRPEDNLPVLFC